MVADMRNKKRANLAKDGGWFDKFYMFSYTPRLE